MTPVSTSVASVATTPQDQSGTSQEKRNRLVGQRAQHMRALEQANRVRLARAELKRMVADGDKAVAEIVLMCPWEADSMTIADLLMAQHRWGRTRTRRFLAGIPMSESKTIGSMTERQRNTIAARLNGETVVDPFNQGFAPPSALQMVRV